MTTEDKTSMTIKPTHRPRRSRQNRSARKRGELRVQSRITGAQLGHEAKPGAPDTVTLRWTQAEIALLDELRSWSRARREEHAG